MGGGRSLRSGRTFARVRYSPENNVMGDNIHLDVVHRGHSNTGYTTKVVPMHNLHVQGLATQFLVGRLSRYLLVA